MPLLLGLTPRLRPRAVVLEILAGAAIGAVASASPRGMEDSRSGYWRQFSLRTTSA